jgi:molybdopterin molybdotransferase
MTRSNPSDTTGEVHLTSVEAARQRLLDITPVLSSETVELVDALGRVLAHDAVSDIDVAPFDNSAMDGFALIAADIAEACPTHPVDVEVVAHIGAGDWYDQTLERASIARIMTGAPVPGGADSVVKVEDTSLRSGDGSIGSLISFTAPVRRGANIRHRGEEVTAGAVVLHAGEVLDPAAIGLLAATGHPHVEVYRRPRVAVVSTGSELVDTHTVPGRGQIRNSNSYSIGAQVRAAGGIPIDYPCIADTFEATEDTLMRAAQCDFVITSGGVSVGDFDYVKPVLEKIGTMHYCNVNMRPGKPQTMGEIERTPFFGLPGNPTSTYVGFEVFVRPALRKMQGFCDLVRPVSKARITHEAKKHQDRRYFLRGVVTRDSNDELVCAVQGNQSSALLTSAHEGNALIVLPEGMSPVAEGTVVDCIRLDIDEGVVL